MAQNLNELLAERLKKRKFHVLVVDDDELNQMIINELLKRWDITPVFSESGEEALELIGNHPKKFDLILMDVYLPQMSGMETTQQLRTKFTLNIPIIALTADAMRDTQESILAAGMNAVLHKPLKPDTFHQTLGHYIQIRLNEKET